MRGRRGLSLLDTILALSLLLIILGLTFELFMTGARSFASGERQHDLSRQATIALDRVTRNLESARPDSLTVAASAISFLTCRDGQNQLALNNDSTPLWQGYELYFLDAGAHQLKQRRLPLATPSSTLQPLEEYNDGSGVHALNFYCNSTEVVARQVAVFELQRPQSDRVNLRLRLELAAEGQQKARHLEVQTAVLLRMK